MSGASPLMNGNVSNVNQLNGHKMKSEKKQHQQQQQQQGAMGQNFMNQSLAAVENFMKNSGVLPNSNLFLPMIPNLHDLRKYENYGVMNAALFASLSNPLYPINLNPYHIQNLLKLSGVPNLNLPMDDESQKTSESDMKSPRDRNPEDLIEEVNEHEESKLVMDIDYDDHKSTKTHHTEDNNNDENDERNDSDEDELMSNNEHNIMSPKIESHEKSPSPVTNSIKQEHNEDESQNDSLRCRHCDKVFNHPAEHLQHETVLCSSLMMKKHEGLMMHMVDAMNNSNSNLNMNDMDDMDDRESKISTESERKVRVRTAISEEQQTILKEFYAINPRPNREDFRNIAQRLMLDARVVQVWFQNNRSRERKQNGVATSFKHENHVSIMSGSSSGSEEQPLDLSLKKEMMTDAPTTSPRYGTVPMQDAGVMNLSRKMSSFSPIFQPNFSTDFLSRQIPSPNEAVSHLQTAAGRNGMAYNLPLGLPLERLLHFTPEMARNPFLMKSDPRSPANSLSPGSSEKRSWKDDESRSFDDMQQQSQPYHPQRRMPKMKSEIPPDSSEFQFVCDLCDKAFRKQSSLARHKYEHSGELMPHSDLLITNFIELPKII